jgi:hypothetical protein
MAEILSAIVLIASCGWSAYVVAARWYPAAAASTSVRLSAATLVAYWLLTAMFLGLAAIGQFRPGVALLVWPALAATLHVLCHARREAREALRADVARAAAVAREWRESPPAALALAAIGGLVAVRLARSLLAPPLGWDSFTYHLVKPASWIQAGGFTREAAPDAWGYYEYFQPYGEVLWAWAMLPVRGDALIGPAGILVWATGVLGVYAAARTFGAGMRPATLGALAVGLTPAVVNFATTGYVDNTTLALLALSVVFLQRWLGGGAPVNAVLAVAGLAVLGGVKFSALPPVALGMCLVAATIVARRRRTGGSTAGVLAACAIVAALALPPYLRAWHDTGSPAYPFRVQLAGVTIAEGDPQLDAIFARRVPTNVSVPRALFAPDVATLLDGRQQFLNLGPAGAILALLGLYGFVTLLRCPDARLTVAFLGVTSAVVVAALANDDTAALRTVWLQVLGRRLLDPLVVAAVLATVAPLRSAMPLLWVAVISNALLAVPLGWGAMDARALAAAAWPLLSALAALVFLSVVVATRLGRRRLVAAAALALLAVTLGWPRIRDVRAGARYDYFREATLARVYDAGRLPALTMESFTVWRYLDQAAGQNVAISAGWWENGHNWYRYPLYGSRLQNRVRYVPITSDGSVVDYRETETAAARADYDAWLRRLMTSEIDYLVLLPPDPPELRWVQAHPELFAPVADGFQRRARAYRFDRQQAARALDLPRRAAR